jgi:hypothetical protein
MPRTTDAKAKAPTSWRGTTEASKTQRLCGHGALQRGALLQSVVYRLCREENEAESTSLLPLLELLNYFTCNVSI